MRRARPWFLALAAHGGGQTLGTGTDASVQSSSRLHLAEHVCATAGLVPPWDEPQGVFARPGKTGRGTQRYRQS
jgi:hypothetical protein